MTKGYNQHPIKQLILDSRKTHIISRLLGNCNFSHWTSYTEIVLIQPQFKLKNVLLCVVWNLNHSYHHDPTNTLFSFPLPLPFLMCSLFLPKLPQFNLWLQFTSSPHIYSNYRHILSTIEKLYTCKEYVCKKKGITNKSFLFSFFFLFSHFLSSGTIETEERATATHHSLDANFQSVHVWTLDAFMDIVHPNSINQS